MSGIETIHEGKTAVELSAPKPVHRLQKAAMLLLFLCAAAGIAQAQVVTSPILPSAGQIVSTVPANGDTNPYGVAFVPSSFAAKGLLAPGDLLVSSFNSKAGLEGVGSTIVEISPAGKQSLFYKGTNVGLTTALNVLRSGYVMVGNIPTTDGTCGTIGSGSLIFTNSMGQQVLNYTNSDLVDQPWDATVVDYGSWFYVFVSNAKTGEISRLYFKVTSTGPKYVSGTVIASGYQHVCNSNLIIAETGLAYDAANDILYVASTMDNAVYGILGALKLSSDAGRGSVIYEDSTHLHGPNALILAPNGDLVAGNSDFVNANANAPSEYVEFTTSGAFVKELSIDPAEGGSFGLGAAVFGNSVKFAAVDDNKNLIEIWTLPLNLNP